MKNTLCLCITLLCLSSGLKSQEFNFALITDLHVTKDSLAYNDLKRSIEQINHTPNLSFVLVTGDLTEEGDTESLLKVKELLDSLTIPYYAIPGNHETKWSESGSTAFNWIFNDERFKFNYNGFVFLGFNTGPVIRMMDGHVSQQDIQWLEKQFSAEKKGTPFILVTHYPLQKKDVDNWYEVTRLAQKYNVKVVLGGHYHKNMLVNYDGIPGILNRSNLRDKTDNTGGYSIYKITNDSILVYEQKINKEPVQWGGYSLIDNYKGKNIIPDYPSDSINRIYPNVKEKWVKQIDYSIYSSPVIYDNKIYVGDDNGTLSCLSLTDGSLIWKFDSLDRIVGTPDVEDNTVVFGSAFPYVYAINATTGKQKWKYRANKAVLGCPVIKDGVVYIGASDNTFRALDLKYGDYIWGNNQIKGYIETRPLIYQGKVIFGAWDNNMYALDQYTGKTIWKWDGGLTRMHLSPAAVWPVGAHNKVFFTAPDRVMTALDVNTGKTIWRTNESMVRETIGLSEDSTRIYSKTMQDSVVCYSATTDFPQRIWITNVGYGYDHAPSMLAEKEGTVFGSTKNGIIFALEGKTGKLLWKHKIGNSLINTVVPLSRSECVFTSADGLVGIIKDN